MLATNGLEKTIKMLGQCQRERRFGSPQEEPSYGHEEHDGGVRALREAHAGAMGVETNTTLSLLSLYMLDDPCG